MPEQATTPTISTTATSDAQVILSAAERLSGALSLRKEQVTVLLSHCHELVNHIAGHEDVQHEAGEMSSTSGMVNLKSYVSSLPPSSKSSSLCYWGHIL